MKTLSIAFRNLLRNRRRSTRTLLAMVIGLTAVLLFGGYARNVTYGLQTNFVRGEGHLQIQRKNYFLYGAGDPMAYGIDHYQHVIDVVRNDPVLSPLVTVATPILSVSGIAGNYGAGVSSTVIGLGVVVADQNRMRQWNDYGFPMHFRPLSLTATAANAAVIGMGLGRILRLCGPLAIPNCALNDVHKVGAGATPPDDIAQLSAMAAADMPKTKRAGIQLLTANAYGAPNVAQLAVVKAESQGVRAVDDRYLQLHLEQAQKLIYGNDPGKVTAIAVQLRHTADLPAAMQRIRQLEATTLKQDDLDVLDFRVLSPQYLQITGMFRAIFGFVTLLIGVIVMFMVGNTMSMAVMERTVEIGTLRAMGLRRLGVLRIFLMEGALLGLLGAAVGVSCALLAAWAINHGGFRWTPPGEIDAVPLTVRVFGETRMIVGYAVGIVAISAISAFWPARRAARMPIVDALSYA
ncbi:permease [Trinickia caryophylli]|uniref:Putative ABC transport system permease protein n=1 Tax=Trinickia caryophylli TaxID=28094 RepID=A0A1X7G6I0_TRICW|nr:ABC transporter permease [Trinickia caryophylli]TRX14312.1 ABC transporter permease [Trinickia caryophylli]GLU33358.1 permease [Trinickia caryophylli]SMF64293.1 putative ABC transport system permease protein [Trinickia caryophylli]